MLFPLVAVVDFGTPVSVGDAVLAFNPICPCSFPNATSNVSDADITVEVAVDNPVKTVPLTVFAKSEIVFASCVPVWFALFFKLASVSFLVASDGACVDCE